MSLWHYPVIQDKTWKRKKINNNSTYQNVPTPIPYNYVNYIVVNTYIGRCNFNQYVNIYQILNIHCKRRIHNCSYRVLCKILVSDCFKCDCKNMIMSTDIIPRLPYNWIYSTFDSAGYNIHGIKVWITVIYYILIKKHFK